MCKEKKSISDAEIFSDEKDSGNNAQLIPKEKEKEKNTGVIRPVISTPVSSNIWYP